MKPRLGLPLRAFAALFAVTLTLASLFALNFREIRSDPSGAPERITYLKLYPSSESLIKSGLAVLPKKQNLSTARNDKVLAENPTPQHDSIGFSSRSVTIEASPDQITLSEGPTAAASTPIRLDAATIRNANHASKSEFRKLAAGSTAYIDDAPLSESAKLGTAIARTAKPDCLGPNVGGSLLAPFVIAYLAIQDKCR